MTARFLQLHTLTSYPAALLNRDDAGFAKRIPFGGSSRTRISSQCLKRHWRTFTGEHSLSGIGVPMAVRSRLTFDRLIVKPLVASGFEQGLATAVTEALMVAVLGQGPKAKKEKDAAKEPSLQTGQITVLGQPEIDYLLSEATAICKAKPDAKKIQPLIEERLGKSGRKNLDALRHAAGLDAALFGRMVTSDILARGDAAVHVAHAFTVHAESAESDYFSAVDDLLRGGDDDTRGSGHIGNTELTSGLFYGYVVVDLPLLVSNLEGCDAQDWMSADRTIAAQVIERLVHLISTVSPGAKLGSTAPYSYAHLVLAEVGDVQPRTLANAFLKPVRDSDDLLTRTYDRIAEHLTDLDGMYGKRCDRRLSGLGDASRLAKTIGAEKLTLDGMGSWLAKGLAGDR